MEIRRDRIEEAGKAFFERAAKGYQAIAAAEPNRVKPVDANGTLNQISSRIWKLVEPLVRR
jgi:thymidylate kinase